MEAIREIKKVRGHKVTIEIPKNFAGLEVEIIVLPLANRQQLPIEKLEPLLLSESALTKDWLGEQEDEAWKNL